MRVAVVGAGAAGLAATWHLVARGAEVTLLERTHRVGGLIETERTADGLLLEHGPDALALGPGRAQRLLADLGLEPALVGAGRAPRRALVAGPRGLVAIPEDLLGLAPRSSLSIVRASFLGLAGRMRVALEPFIAPSSDEDESVDSFFHRRFGASLAERLALPMMRGIHGEIAPELSMATVLPELHGLEHRHGSVAAGMARRIASTYGGPARRLVSLTAGMEQLPRALASALGARVRLGSSVELVELRPSGVRLRVRDAGTLEVDAVVLAVPAPASARLLEQTDPHLAQELRAIPYRDVTMVTLAFERRDLGPLPAATGVVVSREVGLTTTAVTFASEKWHGRAPEDRVIVRMALAQPASVDEGELLATARADLRALFSIDAPPSIVRVRRIPQALPSPLPGHRMRTQRIERWARALGPIALAGNAYRGAGVSDCISSGTRAAIAIATETRARRALG